MIALDYSILWQILLFLVLWVVLSKVFFRPYIALLDERERKTAGAQEEYSDLEDEGERLRAQYEDGIAKAAAAGNATKDSISQEGRQQREDLINRAREEAAHTLARVRLEIQNQLANERELALQQAEAVAHDMVSKILGRRVG
ncbi:MAG: hypothetical protein GEU77_05390 [Deltaproteobacteria bacterium]|nr:hypothetical protein [Deltaproteobacteria bacterium]